MVIYLQALSRATHNIQKKKSMAAAVEAIDYYADAESSFPEGTGGGEIATEYEGIVIVDIHYGKGFDKLSDTMDKIDPYLLFGSWMRRLISDGKEGKRWQTNI